ncbi:MAG: hypothetical protein QG617_31 [Campylobacterota bacterium]|nr:hypothetical protein [Campylobacterota bacterium]
MKKLLTLLFSAVILSTSGYADKGTQTAAATVEPTGELSAYLSGAHMSVADAEAKLKTGGFEVLATYESVKDGHTIIFTCPSLKKQAALPNRANIAVMKLFVDDETKKISLTNPLYFGKAYMQQDYNHDVFSAVAAKLEALFPDLTPSAQMMQFSKLASYHFALGMPFYEDTELLGDGTSAELLAKLKEYKKGKDFIYEVKISDDTTLVGYGLSAGTKRFVTKIDRQNAGFLPWPIVVGGGEATTLKTEYYIPLNYPLLDMMLFREIAPSAREVIKELRKPFK